MNKPSTFADTLDQFDCDMMAARQAYWISNRLKGTYPEHVLHALKLTLPMLASAHENAKRLIAILEDDLKTPDA